ncbi:hypothetical protein HBB16_16690 [Pseudonocardia sp. MCCB 268]|nr:hypothetical protein [Pseudonocardia cytotoxica]
MLVGRRRPAQTGLSTWPTCGSDQSARSSGPTPLALFAGTPLYLLYLRALGARVGRDVTVLSEARAGVHRPHQDRRRHGDPEGPVPVRYRAYDGVIQIGPVTPSVSGARRGEDRAGSARRSATAPSSGITSLHAGQAVPPGRTGTARPRSRPAPTTDRAGAPGRVAAPGRVPNVPLLFLIAVTTPLVLVGAMLLPNAVPQFGALIDTSTPAFTSFVLPPRRLSMALPAAGGSLAGLLAVGTPPRLLQPLVRRTGCTAGSTGLNSLGAPGDRRVDQLGSFHRAVRDSVLHRRLPALDRYRLPRWCRPAELRMAVQHESPYLSPAGRGHGRRRRAVAAQRRPLGVGLPCRRCRSARTTSSATTSPTRRRAAPGTTARSRRR